MLRKGESIAAIDLIPNVHEEWTNQDDKNLGKNVNGHDASIKILEGQVEQDCTHHYWGKTWEAFKVFPKGHDGDGHGHMSPL